MKRTLLRVFLALLLVALVVVIAGSVFVYRDAWVSIRTLSAALKGARRVVLVEYSGDIEIARKIASPDEISRLRRATNVWLRPFVPKPYPCFEPHHRIEILRYDDSEVNTDICFLCYNFVIENRSHLAPLPPYLGEPLASFFTSVGMAPKTHDEYGDIEISQRRRQNKEQKDADEAAQPKVESSATGWRR